MLDQQALRKKKSHLSLNQDQTIENHKLIRLQQQTTKENEQIKPWRKPLMQLKKIHVH
jgi:hypothetical protein